MSYYPTISIQVVHLAPHVADAQRAEYGLPVQREYYRAMRYVGLSQADWCGPIRATRAQAAKDRPADLPTSSTGE